MGKNTPERQDFIIDNLRIEKDLEDGLSADKVENDEEIDKAS
jgi:hypothetical protein